MMKVRLASLAFAIAIFPMAANAQLTVTMDRIRCEQYLAMAPAQSENFSAWMSGWYSYKVGKTWVDLVAFEKNINNVKAWCKYHPNETVMSGLDKATSGQ